MISPVGVVAQAEDRLEQFGAAGAQQAGDAEHLALMQGEGDAVQTVGHREVPDLEHDGCLGAVVLGACAGAALASPLMSSATWSELMLATSCVPISLPSRSTVRRVGDERDLLHAVRDVDDGHAGRGKPADQRQQRVDLVGVQRAGGFVEDEHLRFVDERLGDLDHLLLGQREQPDLGSERDVDAEPASAMRAHGLRSALLVDEAALLRPAAQGDVLGNAEAGHQAEFLVHDGDAAGLRCPRAGPLDTSAPSSRSCPRRAAAIRRCRFTMRGLAGAVLAQQGADFTAAQFKVDRIQARSPFRNAWSVRGTSSTISFIPVTSLVPGAWRAGRCARRPAMHACGLEWLLAEERVGGFRVGAVVDDAGQFDAVLVELFRRR